MLLTIVQTVVFRYGELLVVVVVAAADIIGKECRNRLKARVIITVIVMVLLVGWVKIINQQPLLLRFDRSKL